MLGISAFIYVIRYDDINHRLFHWHSGLKHGMEISYYSDGSIEWLRHWHNGQQHGIDIRYYLNGSISWLRHWCNELRHGMEIYYLKGLIYQLMYWRNGKKIELTQA